MGARARFTFQAPLHLAKLLRLQGASFGRRFAKAILNK